MSCGCGGGRKDVSSAEQVQREQAERQLGGSVSAGTSAETTQQTTTQSR